ncbi:TPA_asm: P3 [Mentha alphacytorhabdovirus 1]|nr:TPA_asm: P3 [Mentha alphacytorhabdovirus 1]
MRNTFSFKIVTELTTTTEGGRIALTKKLNFWNLIIAKWSANVRIRRIIFSYESRVGALGQGVVTAQIIDNRLDEDLGSNVLKSVSFDVRQNAYVTWEHDVQLSIQDLQHPEDEPIVLTTNVSGSNSKDGFSLGQIVVKIELETYDKMLRGSIKSRPATLRLSEIPEIPNDVLLGEIVKKPVAKLVSSKTKKQISG